MVASDGKQIWVVIPAYKLDGRVVKLIESIPRIVSRIIVIDDACPQKSGELIEKFCKDARVTVYFNKENLGVGGSVKKGYKIALENGAKFVIKLDGDGQMDPREIPNLVEPLINHQADYTKGNRFYTLNSLKIMPKKRLFGNSVLSAMSKFSTGYWNISDPNNGFTAISRSALEDLDLNQISDTYFFESDMLFRLYCNRAVVRDIPMNSIYGDEKSSLSISKATFEFFFKHLRNSIKRFFYAYILRDASVATIELPLGSLLLMFGVANSVISWLQSSASGVPNNPGTVMLSGLAILTGVQFILAFISYDVSNVPRKN
jgi:glycosyltransferase involved in cell wall biosynthesis